MLFFLVVTAVNLNELFVFLFPADHLSLHRHRQRAGKEGQVLHRSKRGWVWNQFFVIEEYTGPDPVLVGRVSLERLSVKP